MTTQYSIEFVNKDLTSIYGYLFSAQNSHENRKTISHFLPPLFKRQFIWGLPWLALFPLKVTEYPIQNVSKQGRGRTSSGSSA
jgi:hypothetical protein